MATTDLTPSSYREALLPASMFTSAKPVVDTTPVAQTITKKFSQYASLIPQVNTAISNSTPQMNRVLNPDITKIGAKTTDYGGSTRYEKFHPGLDIANKIGTPIPAVVQGTVTSVDTGHKQGDKAYGNTITITDPWGNKHRYSHLNQVFVKVGQKVGKGQEVATMGNTGQTYSTSGGTGSHLDYRIVSAYNKYVNPYTYLKNLT